MRFGLISDVQYADIPNGFSFGGMPRYYRASLQSLARAVKLFKQSDVEFCMHLGDILDGFNPPEQANAALDKVVQVFDGLEKPTYHMIGNHCLYNHPRKVLNTRLRMGDADGVSYYSFSPSADWRFIILDGYDVSTLGWPPGHPLHEQAQAILEQRNPNQERRFVMFGGGLSASQLEWLNTELRACEAQKQRALLFCHLPLHPDTCSPVCLLWNYEDVLHTLQQYPGTCVATFSGHAHWDGEYTDANGVYHRVMKGVIETPEGEDCAAIVELTDSEMNIFGTGEVQSAKVSFTAPHTKRRKSSFKKPFSMASSFKTAIT